MDGTPAVFIDNALLDPHRDEGLLLHLDRFTGDATGTVARSEGTRRRRSAASPSLLIALPGIDWHGAPAPIGERLTASMFFFFRRQPVAGPEGHDLLEEAIAPAMPLLVTSPNPALDAARYHTQIEFDRTWRTIQREPAYRGKNVLFMSGLNVDVSPHPGMLFPLTKFVPWAACARRRDGTSFLLEQDELFETLMSQSTENADQISFDAAIETMARADSIELPDV